MSYGSQEAKLAAIEIVKGSEDAVDLRSDTVTKPTPAMRKAMFEAEVGDDVMGEDPTITRLEETVAKLLGKEAGLFVPSGTMSNLIAIMVHCKERGSEVILGEDCHIALYEQGGVAQIAGVHSRTVANAADGTMDLDKIESLVRTVNVHFPVTRLLCLENTQNYCGGRVLTQHYTEECRKLCNKHGLKLHIDGARIWNAATYLRTPVASLCSPADSVSVCLSKGLGAPVGSVLVGRKSFIAEARRVRKALGGGMRQAGVIAAAGLVAIEEMRGRLGEDHSHAKRLAQALSKMPGAQIDPTSVQTNIVFFNIEAGKTSHTAATLVRALGQRGVMVMALGPMRVRMVTHFGVTSGHVARAIKALEAELGADAVARHAESLLITSSGNQSSSSSSSSTTSSSSSSPSSSSSTKIVAVSSPSSTSDFAATDDVDPDDEESLSLTTTTTSTNNSSNSSSSSSSSSDSVGSNSSSSTDVGPNRVSSPINTSDAVRSLTKEGDNTTTGATGNEGQVAEEGVRSKTTDVGSKQSDESNGTSSQSSHVEGTPTTPPLGR